MRGYPACSQQTPDLFVIQQHPAMLGRSSGQRVLAPACPTAPFLPPSFPSTTASCELSSPWHLSTFRDASGAARAISGHCCSWEGPCQWFSSQQAPSSLSGASDPRTSIPRVSPLLPPLLPRPPPPQSAVCRARVCELTGNGGTRAFLSALMKPFNHIQIGYCSGGK